MDLERAMAFGCVEEPAADAGSFYSGTLVAAAARIFCGRCVQSEGGPGICRDVAWVARQAGAKISEGQDLTNARYVLAPAEQEVFYSRDVIAV